jgi:LysM repeat protein
VFNDTVKSNNQCLIDTSAKVQNFCASKIIVHFVKRNETLETIAKKYDITKEQLCSWNSLSDSVSLKTNDELIIFKDTK